MKNHCQRGDVDQAMQFFPAFPHFSHEEIKGSNRQEEEDKPRQRPQDDERFFQGQAENLPQIETIIHELQR